MKQQLLAGRIIVFPALLGKGDGEDDTYYDHLQVRTMRFFMRG